MLLADERHAAALEADLQRWYGLDLLDFYRGRLSLRRLCVLVGHLPPEAALWRIRDPRGGWNRTDSLLLGIERRVTGLWADVGTALGRQITDEQLACPVDLGHTGIPDAADAPEQAETLSLRQIAAMMNGQ